MSKDLRQNFLFSLSLICFSICSGEKSFQVQGQGSLFKIEIVEKEFGDDDTRDKTDVTPREILYLRSSKTFNEIQKIKDLPKDITFIKIESLNELYYKVRKLNNIFKNDSFETSFSASENIGHSLTLSEALIKGLHNFYKSAQVPSSSVVFQSRNSFEFFDTQYEFRFSKSESSVKTEQFTETDYSVNTGVIEEKYESKEQINIGITSKKYSYNQSSIVEENIDGDNWEKDSRTVIQTNSSELSLFSHVLRKISSQSSEIKIWIVKIEEQQSFWIGLAFKKGTLQKYISSD
jgi:hypothetical protein